MTSQEIRAQLERLGQANYVICQHGKALYHIENGAVVPNFRAMQMRRRRQAQAKARCEKGRITLDPMSNLFRCMLTLPMRFA